MPVSRQFLLLAALALGCRTAPTATPAPGTTTLRVVSYNIRHGRGMDNEVNLPRTAEVLRRLQPDIVGLQEVDSVVERSGRVAEAQALGDRLGLQHAFGGFMAYQGGQYGMGILSRFPIRRVIPVRLPDGNEPRIALAAELDAPGVGPLMVVNVHFDWVASDSFRIGYPTSSWATSMMNRARPRWRSSTPAPARPPSQLATGSPSPRRSRSRRLISSSGPRPAAGAPTRCG